MRAKYTKALLLLLFAAAPSLADVDLLIDDTSEYAAAIPVHD
jgi:hypothetical protein